MNSLNFGRHWGNRLTAGGLVAISAVLFDGCYLGPSNEKAAADRQCPRTDYLERVKQNQRKNWKYRIEEAGLTFGKLPGVFWGRALYGDIFGWTDYYWNEEACYNVHSDGMWSIQKASYELHSMCLEAVAEVVEDDMLLQAFGIPQSLWAEVRRSWHAQETDLMGRLDLLWDGKGPPKFAEYNADTPTVLIESASAQRQWLKDKMDEPTLKGKGQFNHIDERLVQAFTCLEAEDLKKPMEIIFSAQSYDKFFKEERQTTKYIQAAAALAGCSSKFIGLEHLQSQGNLLPIHHEVRKIIWKMYPYEWLSQEDLGQYVVQDHLVHAEGRVRWMEPAWKLILSSKAILPYLWSKHPDHPNLLPAYFTAEEMVAQSKEAKHLSSEWVAKPMFGREGQGLTYSDYNGQWWTELSSMVGGPAHQFDDWWAGTMRNSLKDHPVWHPRETEDEKHADQLWYTGWPVYQEYHAPARLMGRTVITSCWVIRGQPCGACFREDSDRTTNNNSCFVPHVVTPASKWVEDSPDAAADPSPDTEYTYIQPMPYPITYAQERLRKRLYGEEPDTPPTKRFVPPQDQSESKAPLIRHTRPTGFAADGGGAGGGAGQWRSYHNDKTRRAMPTGWHGNSAGMRASS
ncbi:hypothetical protein CYMTET_10482 [Cymbomonas tetramitiformis]|uniref:Glutathionylspermidine synthase pre-ATP-grasp-like domain-containing protein n=1 Tax=Cymbomonas tetramitiformis TaxID=36881 RepID=A0AAE0LEF0_9CHLO|nr:hypothetical protein CYMTET_10482 [Cymbomonas tetramitiformis]